jgi:photosystem II stability/assembly factor-like uncharacterized protein
VVESDPRIFYVATASGGIWKTVNNGTTFVPVFDDYEVSSIGDIALAPSDPQTLYAGTGEPNNRQSSSWGNGVYRTRDGGKTWTHVGLSGTQAIGRIVVHPTNADVAYVAALGPLWGPGGERGLFKTTDGGRTWTNTKSIDADTGFVDVAMDPQSPDTLYAASYQRRRQPFGYSGGGPGAALWKTTDGGGSWKKLTKGLPEGERGRTGIAIYRRDPKVVYVTVEHAKEGGVYRSEDAGESFAKVSATNPRPSYYSQIHVDPNNDLRLWVLGAPMFFSEDGGKTWKTDRVPKVHGDYHALWIDPANSDHMFVGSDGGLHLTWDGGRTMDYLNTVPLAQFYEVSVDSATPYRVCGGLQDNGSWCGPSRTLDPRGISNDDWFRVGGGDGFYTVVDPADPDTVYVESQDGNVRRFDRRTNETRNIRPLDPEGERHRFNWNSPILVSPHDHRTVYYGGNRLFGSKDRGETWTLVTQDLTNAQKRDELPIFGKKAKEFLSRNDGVVHWGTITTVAESPLRAGILWVGTDDGNLQVSRDGGSTWANVTARIPGVPKGTYVSRVEASRRGEGAAYAAFDGHRGDDFKPYLFATDDFGQTWKAISAGLPQGGTLSVVREHPKKTEVLFAGTERGLFVSWNRGGAWTRVKANLPTMPVDDIQIHPRENDLVLGTHGRGVWILDDLTPLLEAPFGLAAGKDVELFEPRAAAQTRTYNGGGSSGHKAFFGDNPPEGALLTYFLKDKPDEKAKVKITVKNAAGEVVREMDGAKEQGLNRAAWDLRHEAPIPPDPEFPTFFGPLRGTLVPPGSYTVTVAVGDRSASRGVTVSGDPRLSLSAADRDAWYDASRRAGKIWGRANAANKRLGSLKKQLEELQGKLEKDEQATEVVKKATSDLKAKVEAQAKMLDRQEPLGFAGAPLADDPVPLLEEARGLYFSFSAITAAPTAQQAQYLPRVEKKVGEAMAGVNALLETDVPAFNRLLLENGRGLLEAGAAIR